MASAFYDAPCPPTPALIDDRSAYAPARWRFFTDVVMGGVSSGNMTPKITTKPFPKVYYSGPSTAYRKELVRAFERVKEAYLVANEGPFPVACAEVCLYVWGLRRNADPDNMAKQVLDALVTAGILAEDDWTHVPVLVVRCYSTTDHAPGIHVNLAETEIV